MLQRSVLIDFLSLLSFFQQDALEEEDDSDEDNM